MNVNNEKNIKSIAFFGSGTGQAGDVEYDAMTLCGEMVAKSGIEVWTGGYNGPGMGGPTKGAKKVNGMVVGYVLSTRIIPKVTSRPNSDLSQVVNCYAESGEKSLEVAYCHRIGCLSMADAFIFSAGGGLSSFSALAQIIEMNDELWIDLSSEMSLGKRIAILSPPGTTSRAYMGENILVYEPAGGIFVPRKVKDFIRVCSTPGFAVNWVLDIK